MELKSELILSGTSQSWHLRIIIRECEICADENQYALIKNASRTGVFLY